MALYFDNCGLYVQSATTLQAKIASIDAIIDALEAQALNAAATQNLTEYQLNDGQTIIRQTYRGAQGIANAINQFEAIKQRYVNRLNGRVYRAMDSKNFPNGGY
jgi:multidrug efflux pump subunit AcrA (membrane-fusion protein)